MNLHRIPLRLLSGLAVWLQWGALFIIAGGVLLFSAIFHPRLTYRTMTGTQGAGE